MKEKRASHLGWLADQRISNARFKLCDTGLQHLSFPCDTKDVVVGDIRRMLLMLLLPYHCRCRCLLTVAAVCCQVSGCTCWTWTMTG